jgi:pimeloyl-ACP methyl ester carboxylesterase
VGYGTQEDVTLPRPPQPRRSGRRLLKILGGLIALYAGLHLVLVPVLSFMTRTPHARTATPRQWGVPYQTHRVDGTAGAAIPAWYIPGKSNKPIILVLTGSGGNKFGTIARATAISLNKRGYNVFLFDTRGQGLSGGIKTYGVGETADVIHVLDYLALTFPGKRIGGVGFSLGAATLLRTAGLDQRLGAVVSYASYGEIDGGLVRTELRYQLRHLLRGRVPKKYQRAAATTADAASWTVCPFLARASLKAWSLTFHSVPTPLEAVALIADRPLLFIHNSGDPEVPASHLAELYRAAATPKKFQRKFSAPSHEPPFWSESFRGQFSSLIGQFFDANLR